MVTLVSLVLLDQRLGSEELHLARGSIETACGRWSAMEHVLETQWIGPILLQQWQESGEDRIPGWSFNQCHEDWHLSLARKIVVSVRRMPTARTAGAGSATTILGFASAVNEVGFAFFANCPPTTHAGRRGQCPRIDVYQGQQGEVLAR